MSDEHETTSDIIAEMRGMGNYQRYSGDHARVLAGRLEAAHRRERGDAAKLREALKAISGLCAGLMPTWDGAIGRIKDVADAALSAPPRNCDVGTAEEQSDRMDAVYCSKRLCAKGKCPLFKPGGDCSLIWAQMPYEAEKGGAK